MANPEHLEILRKGVKEWNVWRKQNLFSDLDLCNAELDGMDLCSVNFSGTNLIGAQLNGAKLNKATLTGACLRDARLNLAELNEVQTTHADLSGAELVEATLVRAKLANTKLDAARLIRANLNRANLNASNCSYTNFSHANLNAASFRGAKLKEANLSDARLSGADFRRAIFEGTEFRGAYFLNSIIDDVDLSLAKNLRKAFHVGPSTIGIDTLYASHGNIPDEFLRGAGVPEDVITHLLPLIRAGNPVQFYSCFISYSAKDEEFARRLHQRMRAAGLRVWFAPEDLKGGEKLLDQLERAIHLHDRLLIVLSDHSIMSDWVMTEIRRARDAERKENRRKLFPIRLTDYKTLEEWRCPDSKGGDLADEVRNYFIPDFSNWKTHDDFEKAFDKLLRDLKAEEAKL